MRSAAIEQSALVVEIPEAGPTIEEIRGRLDSGAIMGVPAHVTILYPFIPPSSIDRRILAQIGELFATVPAFDVEFRSVAWFDESVVYLEPDCGPTFRALTRTVYERWPDFPPYEGVHDDVVPHLTIGDHGENGELEAGAADAARHLPIASVVDEVCLYTGTSEAGSWARQHRFRLAG